MKFPWSMIAAFVVLAVAVALLLVGVLAEEADELITYGGYALSAALAMFAGKGADALQASVRPPPG